MTSKHILLIQGHPDAATSHFCHALAASYATGAHEASHMVRWLNVAELDFPLLRSQKAWEEGELPTGLQQVQDDIRWAEHIVLFFPLWLGDMPALLKGFLEQVARPGFAFEREAGSARLHEEGPDRPLGPHRGHHGHARPALPLVLSRTQRQITGAQHPGFCRHGAGA
ncbi:NAD(P)H-dependent oxidoreductase [Polaromonas sp. P2-4]|nr:NAD(P)H-dependent oxidoreductase [Polaromonas sp. P2-4]